MCLNTLTIDLNLTATLNHISYLVFKNTGLLVHEWIILSELHFCFDKENRELVWFMMSKINEEITNTKWFTGLKVILL